MSWVRAEQVLATVAAQRQVLEQQRARIATEEQFHATERQKVEADGLQAAHDLAQAVLPKLDAPSIAAAAAAVGLAGLPSEDIPGKLEARRAWLASRMSEIARDPRYANAELLRHPRTGSLTTAIAEAESLRGPASEVVATCHDHPRFERLWETGFGTPEQKNAWWRYSYWTDRSAANEILALFPGKTSFAEVREEYRTATETLAVYDAELVRLRAEVASGEALEAEYTALYDEYQNLDARGLEHTRGRIIHHMLTSDTSLLSQRLEASPALRLLFLRTSGLAAKLSYLDGIQRSNVTELERDLATQQERLDNVEARTRKRWAPMPADKYQKLAEDRRPRYEKRWQRFGKIYTQVNAFNRWDRGRRFDELLWWDVMTRGRYDGSYLTEVAMFHQTHPDYRFDPAGLSGSSAGIAVEAGDATDPDMRSDEAEAAALSLDADTDPHGAGIEAHATDAS